MIFDKLFGKKKLKSPADISGLVNDMHSHLIPGIDDGSPDLETSIELIRQMKTLGYQKLYTTPHISNDIFKNTPEVIRLGLEKVRNRLEQEQIDIKIEAAAEYLIDDGFENLMKDNALITFGDKFLLIELPYFNVPRNLYELTFELQVKGYKIILAHPERYLYWYNEPKQFEELKDRGLLFQLNMISLTGHYGMEVRKLAEKLIRAGMIDLLGSDLHNPVYLGLLKKSLYEPLLQDLLNSGKIQNHLL